MYFETASFDDAIFPMFWKLLECLLAQLSMLTKVIALMNIQHQQFTYNLDLMYIYDWPWIGTHLDCKSHTSLFLTLKQCLTIFYSLVHRHFCEDAFNVICFAFFWLGMVPFNMVWGWLPKLSYTPYNIQFSMTSSSRKP